jgi:Protein of unknown function (DUF2917)
MTATHLYSSRESKLATRTALSLGRSDLLALPLQAGDSLRSERGTVWITVDGAPQDILLDPGQEHVVTDTGAMMVSALQSACVSVRSDRPLVWHKVTHAAQPAWAGRALAQMGAWAANAGFYNRHSAAPAAGR